MIFQLLAGIALAAVAFGALLTCGYRIFTAPTRLRAGLNAGTALLVLVVMGVISSGATALAPFTGTALTLAAIATTIIDRGHIWPLTIGVAILGLVVALGLPF